MSVYVFLHSHYADWEIGYILPELVANGHKRVTFAMTMDPITSLGGLKVLPDMTLQQVKLEDVKLLILPGGDYYKNMHLPELDQLVKTLKSRNVPIAAICDATTYLARLGMLNSIDHTGNDLDQLKSIPGYSGSEFYRDEDAVNTQGVITAGGYHAVEFTLELLKELKVYSPTDCQIWYRAFKHGQFSSPQE